MTMCPNSKAACECQPQDGVMCPHGPTPNDWPRDAQPYLDAMERAMLERDARNGNAAAQDKLRAEFGGLLEEIDRSPIPAARVEPIPGGVAETWARTQWPEHQLHDNGSDTPLMQLVRKVWAAASLPSSTPGLDPKEQGTLVAAAERYVDRMEPVRKPQDPYGY